jgi:hypothetical protein
MRRNALLDAVLIPDPSLRVHVYRANIRPGVDLAEIDPGDGDRLQALFADEGTLLKGVAHESNLSPWSDELLDYDLHKVRPGLLDELPRELAKYLAMAELRSNETTFSIWRAKDDESWTVGRAEGPEEEFDGADDLLSEICITSAEYSRWVEEYLEVDVSRSAVSAAFSGTVSVRELIRLLGHREREAEILSDLHAHGLV